MFSKSLPSFIREQINQGHGIGSIRKYLVNYGYSSKDVESAINSLYKEKKPVNKKLILVFAVVIIIVLIIFASFLIIKPRKKEVKPEMSLKIELSKEELMPGETLKFNLDISSTAIKRYILDVEYSILLKSSVLSKDSKKIQFSKRSLTQESLKLPDKIKPGGYVLDVKVYYDSKVESTTSTFRIEGEVVDEEDEEKEIVAEEECPLSCDDNNECTEDTCGEETGFKCLNKPIKPCCGNLDCELGETFDNCEADCKKEEEEVREVKVEEEIFEGLTIWEKIRMIKNLSLTNLKKAEDFCNGVTQETYKDQCFVNIAEAREDIKYCDFVVDDRKVDNCYSAIAESTKDSLICEKVSETRSDYCYMSFVMDGDYSVCPKLKSKYLKQSCETLSKVNKE